MGEGKQRDERRGRGEDESPPTTQATEAQGAGDGNDKGMGGLRTVEMPRPQRGTAADNGSAWTLTTHTASTDRSRPDHGALAYRKYGLLAPMGTAVNPANTGDPGSADGHKATREQTRQDRRET